MERQYEIEEWHILCELNKHWDRLCAQCLPHLDNELATCLQGDILLTFGPAIN